MTPLLFDPAKLVAYLHPQPLRSIARRLELDPAMLCRRWTWMQADRYASKLNLHPSMVWWDEWWAAEREDDPSSVEGDAGGIAS